MRSSAQKLPPGDPDAEFLRETQVPSYERGPHRIRAVDLFCGCGAMTLGLAEAGRRAGCGIDVRLAVDVDETSTKVFSAMFPHAQVQTVLVEFLFDGSFGAPLTAKESGVADAVGPVDFLVGGPPCQGHSDLNNHTRRDDVRNELYLLMARAAEVLLPQVVFIENVPAVLRDRRRAVAKAEQGLRALGYRVASSILDLASLGIPQRRRRHLMIAVEGGLPEPMEIIHSLKSRVTHRSVSWAIADLKGRGRGDPLHRASRISADNIARIDWLFDNCAHDLPDRQRPDCHRFREHTYKSVYGRLWWDRPAQTITTGFASMGQGRHVHPSLKRTLTPREAARLQFLPDFVPFEAVTSRSAWASMIGNAVPPKVTLEFGGLVLTYLRKRIDDGR